MKKSSPKRVERNGRYMGFYVEEEILEEFESALDVIVHQKSLKSRSAAIKDAVIHHGGDSTLRKKWESVKDFMGRHSSLGKKK